MSEGVTFLLIAIPLVICICAGWLLAPWVFAKWTIFRNPDHCRPLNSIERNYLENARNELEVYAFEKSFKSRWNWVFQLTILPGIICSLITYGFALLVFNVLIERRERERDLGNHISSFESDLPLWVVIGLLAAMLSGLFISIWIANRFALLSKKFTQHRLLTHMDRKGVTDEEILTHRRKRIEREVRLRNLDVRDKFSAEHFLRQTYKKFGNNYGLLALALLPIGLFSIYLYSSSMSHFYEDKISFRPAVFTQRKVISYDDIQRVELRCIIDSDGDIGASMNVIYDERSIGHIAVDLGGISIANRLDDLFRSSNLQFSERYLPPWGKKKSSGYKSECFEKIKKEYSPAEMKMFYKVLHFEEMSKE